MPTTAWGMAKDLGLLSLVGAVALLLAIGGVKLIRALWTAHKDRSARFQALDAATEVLLEDALHRPQSGEIRAASDRAAREERLTRVRERLERCRPRRSNR